MADLVVLDGSSFVLSEPSGDLDGREEHGFFHSDVRHLSRWSLLVNGKPVQLLTSRNVDYYSARVFGTLASARVGENPPVGVRRDRIVADGLHEDIVVDNSSSRPAQVTVELLYAADFADIFEVKEAGAKAGSSWIEIGKREVTLWYERDGFRRGTRLAFSQPGMIREDSITFEFRLAPRQRWQTCIDVFVLLGDREVGPRAGHGGFGKLHPNMPLSLDDWLEQAPTLSSDFDALNHCYRRSLLDLAALRFRPWEDLEFSLPAAGLPWFMALFGRDSLITAYQALPFHPNLAKTTLEALAELQATEYDDFRDAEPGKILHELRCGKLASLGEVPHTPYYGTHDATPLFLILLDEYDRFTGDRELVHGLESAARAALAWIEGPGDPDQDGYLEYRTRSDRGLVNQCWKDSWNSILFSDGTIAEPPIATCEIQGYAYDARIRTARLAREVWEDQELGDRLERDAGELRERFNRDFWIEERGHYALALDGQKRRVDSLTSNIGHLLWSGILDEERALLVARQLRGNEMWTGWGIRTMSTAEAGYNPIEYHNGTVWPHDTALIAEGLRRYGFRAEASLLVAALIEAARYFEYRLPEVFAGYEREDNPFPVQYPTAAAPQAWAAGAPLLGLRTLLGLDVVDGTLRADPTLPRSVRRLSLAGIPGPGGPETVYYESNA